MGLGAFEITRAMGNRIRAAHKYSALLFALAVMPIFHFFGAIGIAYLFIGFAVTVTGLSFLIVFH